MKKLLFLGLIFCTSLTFAAARISAKDLVDKVTILSCMVENAEGADFPPTQMTLALQQNIKTEKEYLTFYVGNSEQFPEDGQWRRTVFMEPVSQGYEVNLKEHNMLYVKTRKAWYSFAQPMVEDGAEPSEIVIKQHYLKNGKVATTMNCLVDLDFKSDLSTFKHSDLKSLAKDRKALKLLGYIK